MNNKIILNRLMSVLIIYASFYLNNQCAAKILGLGNNKDTIAPVLTLNGSDTVTMEVFGTYMEDGAVAWDNNDGNISNAIVYDGSINASILGINILTYSVKDSAGNKSSRKRIVIVYDTQKPIILNGDANPKNEIYVQVNSIFIDRTRVTDNYDTPILKINGEVDTRFLGTYTIIYNASDQSGNKADAITYLYIVGDFIAPKIMLNTLDTIFWPLNKAYTPVQASATDNYYTSAQVSLTMKSNVNPYKLGLYFDEYTAIDGSGNITVRRRFVKVEELSAISTLNENNSIRLFPNPSSGKINIRIELKNFNASNIEVYSEIGNLVKKTEGHHNPDAIQMINLDDQPNGLYTIRIITNHTIITRIILLNR